MHLRSLLALNSWVALSCTVWSGELFQTRDLSTACSRNPALRLQRAWMGVIRSVLGRKHIVKGSGDAGWELAVLQWEQREAWCGQTRSLSVRKSISSGGNVGFLSLPATAVENRQAETHSRVFTLGPLGPVIQRAQQCWQLRSDGSVLISV